MKKNALFLTILFAIGTAFGQDQNASNIMQSPRLNEDNQTKQIVIERNSSQKGENDFMIYGGGCNIGNEVDPGWDSGNFGSNFLLGVNFNLTEEGTLNSINLIGNDSGSEVQMAVYDDSGGVPNDLVVSSGVTTVGSGIVTLPVTPTLLQPGDYWIMAIYALGGDHSNVGQGIVDSPVYYEALNFGDPIPTNASGFLNYDGQDFLYFLDITCTLSVEDRLEELVSIYPNPVINQLTIEIPLGIEVFNSTLYDLLGKDTGLRLENNSMNTASLEKGTYILTIETKSGSLTKKIIKN